MKCVNIVMNYNTKRVRLGVTVVWEVCYEVTEERKGRSYFRSIENISSRPLEIQYYDDNGRMVEISGIEEGSILDLVIRKRYFSPGSYDLLEAIS